MNIQWLLRHEHNKKIKKRKQHFTLEIKCLGPLLAEAAYRGAKFQQKLKVWSRPKPDCGDFPENTQFEPQKADL